MRIGLLVPCHVDAFEPDAGVATLELLERLGLDVDYPRDQTCCGQPMTNTGCHEESTAAEALFVRNFPDFQANAVAASTRLLSIGRMPCRWFE